MGIAVFDIGKTNVKLSLVEAGDIRHNLVALNKVVPGPPYPHYDEAALWAFLKKGLASLARSADITDIVIVAHGAACVLLDAENELALPILDYEAPIADAEYDRIASPFSETFTPPMANGLVVGKQVHWQAATFPEAFRRVSRIVTYPQYWSFRLSGVLSSEVTSLACHTGLWQPAAGGYSGFVHRMGWEAMFPPLRKASEILGPVSPAVRAETGLPEDCRVRVGIHDSSASFLRHRLSRPLPFAVVSTGTWVVNMAAGADVAGLPENRNCLANVDALGVPVPCCVFMGGREFSRLTEGLSGAITNLEAAAAVVRKKAFLVPPVADVGGPFAGLPIGRTGGDKLESEEEIVARACLYLALMTDYCLDLLKAKGPVIVEGSLIGNELYLSALAGLRRPETVLVSSDSTGTISGAMLLADAKVEDSTSIVEPIEFKLDAYKIAWREALAA
jgi:sugar (pentulose or hexulose) kinase